MKTTPKHISFSCPLCHTEYEIFFKEIPYLIFISCPQCNESLYCHKGEVHLIDKNTIKEIKGAQSFSEIEKFIDKKNKIEKIEKQVNFDKQEQFTNTITPDDVLNLSIDLARCETIEDIMSLMNG